jgi:hypothetical protein
MARRSASDAVTGGIFLDVKANFLSRSLGRGHQLADGFEQRADGLVVALDFTLQFGEFGRQVPVQSQRLAQTHESAHDGDVDLDRPPAVQDTGKHRHSLFREGIGQIVEMLAAL